MGVAHPLGIPAWSRRISQLHRVLEERAVSMPRLIAFGALPISQRFRFRTLADRIFGLRLISARRHFQREVSYEFMNRQMVWHAFTVRLLGLSLRYSGLAEPI